MYWSRNQLELISSSYQLELISSSCTRAVLPKRAADCYVGIAVVEILSSNILALINIYFTSCEKMKNTKIMIFCSQTFL